MNREGTVKERIEIGILGPGDLKSTTTYALVVRITGTAIVPAEGNGKSFQEKNKDTFNACQEKDRLAEETKEKGGS